MSVYVSLCWMFMSNKWGRHYMAFLLVSSVKKPASQEIIFALHTQMRSMKTRLCQRVLDPLYMHPQLASLFGSAQHSLNVQNCAMQKAAFWDWSGEEIDEVSFPWVIRPWWQPSVLSGTTKHFTFHISCLHEFTSIRCGTSRFKIYLALIIAFTAIIFETGQVFKHTHKCSW